MRERLRRCVGCTASAPLARHDLPAAASSAGDPCRPWRLHGMPAYPHGRAEGPRGRDGAVGGGGRGRPRRPSLRLHGCRARQPACEPRRRWTCPRPSAALCKSTCGRCDPRACAALALPIWPGLLNSTRCRSGSTDLLLAGSVSHSGNANRCGMPLRARPAMPGTAGPHDPACRPGTPPGPAPLRCAGRAAAAGSRPPWHAFWHGKGQADLGGQAGRLAGRTGQERVRPTAAEPVRPDRRIPLLPTTLGRAAYCSYRN